MYIIINIIKNDVWLTFADSLKIYYKFCASASTAREDKDVISLVVVKTHYKQDVSL